MNRKLRPRNSASLPTNPKRIEPTRREFLVGAGGTAVLGVLSGSSAFAQAPESSLNIARVAVPTRQVMTSENRISSLNDGFTPENSFDRTHALYALWAEPAAGSRTSWVQYRSEEPVSVTKVE